MRQEGGSPGYVCGIPQPLSPSVSVFQHRLAWACVHFWIFHPGNHGEQDFDGTHCDKAGAAGEAGGGFQVCLLG